MTIQSLIRAISLLALVALLTTDAAAQTPAVARGKYLVTIGGCGDCHTPSYFLGKPDQAKYLGGSDAGFGIPGLGVFVGRNLTSDKETGLGGWTRKQIITALTTGKRPDGRVLAPTMPWRAYAKLSKADANAIAAYLQSLPPVKHQVAGPFGPTEKSTVPVMAVVPPDAYAGRDPSVEHSRFGPDGRQIRN